MLEFDHYLPPEVTDDAPLIVLLHGRGSDKDDLMALRPGLPAGAMIVTPRAPFPGAPWGYGQGWAWYQFLGGNRPEPDSFEQSQRLLHEFLAALPERLPARHGALTLGGFSQGGTMSFAYALRHPGIIPKVINFSGFLANHPSVTVAPETVRDTRFFWGHGTRDPNIPFSFAEAGRDALAAAGADLTVVDVPIGHSIDATELRAASDWIVDE